MKKKKRKSSAPTKRNRPSKPVPQSELAELEAKVLCVWNSLDGIERKLSHIARAAIDGAVDDINSRLADVSGHFGREIDKTRERLNTVRLNIRDEYDRAMDRKLAGVTKRLDSIDARLDAPVGFWARLRAKFKKNRVTIVGNKAYSGVDVSRV